MGLLYQQFYQGKKTAYLRDVTDYTESIGISASFDRAELYTDISLPGESVTLDERGYAVYGNESGNRFELRTTVGHRLTGQTSSQAGAAVQLLDLRVLDDGALFVFPFSSIPMVRNVYIMTDENMCADGISDAAGSKSFSSAVRAFFIRDGVTIQNSALPFSISNLSNQKDVGLLTNCTLGDFMV